MTSRLSTYPPLWAEICPLLFPVSLGARALFVPHSLWKRGSGGPCRHCQSARGCVECMAICQELPNALNLRPYTCRCVADIATLDKHCQNYMQQGRQNQRSVDAPEPLGRTPVRHSLMCRGVGRGHPCSPGAPHVAGAIRRWLSDFDSHPFSRFILAHEARCDAREARI